LLIVLDYFPANVEPGLKDGFYGVTTAYPARSYYEYEEYRRDSPVKPRLHGNKVSARVAMLYRRPEAIMKFINAHYQKDPSTKYAFRSAAPNPLTPEERALLKRSGNDKQDQPPSAAWKNHSAGFLPDTGGSWYDYFRFQMADQWSRIGTREQELAGKLKREGVPQEDIDKRMYANSSAYSAALTADSAAALSASTLTDGSISYRDGLFIVDPFSLQNTVTAKTAKGDSEQIHFQLYKKETGGSFDILGPLRIRGLMGAFFQYAESVRGKRISEGDENPPPRLVPMSQSDIELGLGLADQYPEIAVAYSNYQRWNNAKVQLLVDSEVMTENLAKVLVEHEDYIPFYLEMEGKTSPIIQALLATESPDANTFLPNVLDSSLPPKLEGRKRGKIMEDRISGISKNTTAIIASAMNNVAKLRAIRNELELKAAKKTKAGPTTIPVRRNGVEEHYELDDPMMFQTLKDVSQGESIFTDWMAIPAEVLREFVTRNPEFMFRNFTRDTLDMYATMGAKFDPMANGVLNMTKSIARMPLGKVNPTFDILRRTGVAGYGYGYQRARREMEKQVRRFAKKPGIKYNPWDGVMKIWDAAGDLSARAETANREAVYELVFAEVFEKTGDITTAVAEAAHQAREFLNYNRRGRNIAMKFMARTFPFFNARIQGMDKLYRAGIGTYNPFGRKLTRRQLALAFVRRGITMAAMSSIYTMLVSDEDEYKSQNIYTRMDNFIFPVGEGKAPIKVPIPFEFGVIFKSIPEMLTQHFLLDQLPRDSRKQLQHSIGSTLGLWPLSPQAMKPLMETAANWNYFQQRPIVPFWMESEETPEYERFPGTNLLAVGMSNVSRGIPGVPTISPLHIENMLRGYTGTIGSYILMAIDATSRYALDMPSQRSDPRGWELHDAPFTKAIFAPPLGRGQLDKYYEVSRAVHNAVSVINHIGKNFSDQPEMLIEAKEKFERELDPGLQLAVKAIDKELKRLRDNRRILQSIPTDQMHPMDKTKYLNEIERKEYYAVRNLPALRKALYGDDWLQYMTLGVLGGK
ncbi:MAG: hypothetical protein NZ807_04715, partial [Dehalococcoidia bacterium]|nr:hypothetical protein [Dehalococcoidia bacterium]